MNDYYKYEIDEVFKELETGEMGLSSKEVEEKEYKYGKNVLPKGDKKTRKRIC